MEAGVDYIGVNVAFLCHDGKGNVLFHLRSDKCRDEHNTWDCGAGQIEFGETPEEALEREVYEEYGCKPMEIILIRHFTSIREHNGKKTHWFVTYFAVRVDPTHVRIMEPERNLKNAWHPIDIPPQPLHSVVAHEFKNFLPQIKKAILN